MATDGKRVIFNSRKESCTIEAIATEAGILPGMAVELGASGLEKYDTEGAADGIQVAIADYDLLNAGATVDDAWTINETMIARELPKNCTANVLVSAGNNITSRGTPLTTSATAGEWKIATPASERVLAYADEIINVTGSAGLVRVKEAKIMFTFNMAQAKKNPANAAILQQQYNHLTNWRNDSRHDLAIQPNTELAKLHAQAHNLQANAGRKPFDLYRDFDPVIVRQFHLDEGDNILQPLMGLSRNVSLGIMVSEFGRSSGMGNFTSSMSGEVGAVYDKVDYDTAKTVVPFHQTGFSFNFREYAQMSLEDFNGAMIAQEEAARRHKKGIIDGFLDGWTDKDGNYITYDGVSWQGFRNDSRVDQVDLATSPAFDFTDQAQTGEDFIEAFIVLAQRHNVTNKIAASITYFVSNEIWWNMARDYSNQKGSNTILERARSVPNVADIRPSSKLSGNEILSMALESRFVQPIVGMDIGSVALARPNYNSPYAFETVSAIGLQVKPDFESGNTAVQFASS